MAFAPDPHVVSLHAGRFEEGPSYRIARPSGSTSWLLIVTEEGLGRVGGLDLVPGEAALFPPRVPQSYRTSERTGQWCLRWSHFHPRADWAPLLALPEAASGVRHVVLGDEAEAVGAALELARIHAARAGDPYEEWLAMGALEAALVRIRRAASHAEARGDARVAAAVRFVRRHLAEPIGPHEMARAAGLSPSRLGALFRQEMSESPRAFVERLRIDRARQILAMSDLPVRAVASEVGFASEFYFANRFRAAVGLSPSAYRAASRAPGG